MKYLGQMCKLVWKILVCIRSILEISALEVGFLMVYQDACSLEILSTHRTERSETIYLLLRENGYYADQNAGEKISIQSIDNNAEVESAFALSIHFW